jgi:hypothetical protein
MKSKVRLAAFAAVGGALLIYSLNRVNSTTVPEPFLKLQDRLAQSSSVQIDFLWPQPGSARQNLAAVRWSRRGKMVVDVLQGPQGRLSFVDGKVRLATADIQPPIPSLNPSAKELMGELLSGFGNSEWRQIDPPKHGFLPSRKDRLWVAITLPFDWARDHELQVGISKETGALEAMVVTAKTAPKVTVTFRQFRGGPMTFEVSDSPQLWLVIEDVQWNRGISQDDFDPHQHP